MLELNLLRIILLLKMQIRYKTKIKLWLNHLQPILIKFSNNTLRIGLNIRKEDPTVNQRWTIGNVKLNSIMASLMI